MGDEEEFREFVRHAGPRLLRSAGALTRDSDLAEDLVQNTLIRVFLAWDRVRAADDTYAYTHRILFTSYSRMRRRRRVAERIDGAIALGPIENSAFVHNEDQLADDRDQLRRALAELSTKARAVIVLRFLEDMSVEQTAECLGCSVGNVKSQTARALARLRRSAQLTIP